MEWLQPLHGCPIVLADPAEHLVLLASERIQVPEYRELRSTVLAPAGERKLPGQVV